MASKIHFPDPKKYKLYLIIFILFIKGCQAYYFIYLTQCNNPEIKLSDLAFASGDTFSYTGAMENFIEKGSYFFFNGKENVYAGRLPHYSLPYLFFRTFLDQESTYNLLVVFQLIIECIATYYLVILFFYLTSNKLFSYLLLCICLVTSNFTQFAAYISPESLSCSLLILSIYSYHQYLNHSSKIKLLIVGTFIGLLTTLKAYFIILFLPIGIHFILDIKKLTKQTLQCAIEKSILVAMPIFLMLLPWTLRNYIRYEKIIPLQINATAGYNYNSADLAFRKFVTAWGGDFIHWEKTSAGCYFIPNPTIHCEYRIPAYAYSSQYDSSDIEKVRTKYILLQKNYSTKLEKEVAADFNSLTKSYINEKPFQFYIYAPLRLAKKFLIHSGSYYLPIHSGNPCYHSWQLALKIIQSLFYWVSLIVGIPGTILIAQRSKNYILPFIALGIIILFPFVLHFAEARYYRTVEPLLYLAFVYVFYDVFKRVSNFVAAQ